jgi:hypothetical protein
MVGRPIKRCVHSKYYLVSFLLYVMALYESLKTNFTILVTFLVIVLCICMKGPLL